MAKSGISSSHLVVRPQTATNIHAINGVRTPVPKISVLPSGHRLAEKVRDNYGGLIYPLVGRLIGGREMRNHHQKSPLLRYLNMRGESPACIKEHRHKVAPRTSFTRWDRRLIVGFQKVSIQNYQTYVLLVLVGKPKIVDNQTITRSVTFTA